MNFLKNEILMKDRCPKSVGDAKQTLEIRVELRGCYKHEYLYYTLISKVSGGVHNQWARFFTVPMQCTRI